MRAFGNSRAPESDGGGADVIQLHQPLQSEREGRSAPFRPPSTLGMPVQSSSSSSRPTTAAAPPRADMSVILVTGSYDHEIRFWEAWSGICSRTIPRVGESGVRSFTACVRDRSFTIRAVWCHSHSKSIA